MIKTQNLSHTVSTQDGALTILSDINLDIKLGESVAIVGKSGSGKSTLLGILAGLDTPSEGDIFLDGRELASMNEEQRARTRQDLVAFVFQNFQLLSSLNALENVALPLEVKGRTDALEQARHFLDLVGLEDRAKHFPSQLSGGEQQRVALARAFACDAPVVFADEPTGNLDSVTGEVISTLLFNMNKQHNTTLVLVTHSHEVAARCDRIFEMNAGVLRERHHV